MARTELTHEELMALQKEYQDSEAEEEAMFHNGAYDDDEPSPDASPRMGNNRRRSESPQYLGRRASGRRGSSPRSSGRYIWQQTEKKETFENEERRVRALEVLESREELAWYASALGESIPQTRLHLTKILHGMREDPPPYKDAKFGDPLPAHIAEKLRVLAVGDKSGGVSSRKEGGRSVSGGGRTVIGGGGSVSGGGRRKDDDVEMGGMEGDGSSGAGGNGGGGSVKRGKGRSEGPGTGTV